MKVIVESSLSKPLSGTYEVEIQPDERVGDVIQEFLLCTFQDVAVFDEDYNRLDLYVSLASQGVTDRAKLYIRASPHYIRTPHLLIVGVSSLIIATFLLITVSVLFGATGGVVPFDYGIVIDAGSTHTEVFLYRWSGIKEQGTGYVSQENYCRFEEGIASVSDPSSIIPCVMEVVKSIPQSVLSQSHLFLGATAGMRILNISEPRDSNLILLTLKYALQSTQMNVSSVNIIEGKDEGVFSWITTNFLTASLYSEKQNEHPWKSTFGALDLGGGSTQFAYALDPSEAIESYDVQKLKLYGKHYFVKSKSFLCFGLQEAFTRHEALLIEDIHNTTIYDPCLPKQFILNVTLETMIKDPCMLNRKFDDWIENSTKVLHFIGLSDYKACKQSVLQLFNRSACIEAGFQECLEKYESVAQTGGRFMAFSSFYYVAHFLKSTNVTLEEFLRATQNLCSLSWDEIQNKNDTHLPQYCFGAIYIAEILSSTYGFNSSTWKNIIFQQQINNSDVGWSLGYMIDATNAIPEELPSLPVINTTVFVMLVILSICIVFLAVYLIRKNKFFCCKKQEYRIYENLDQM